MKLLLFQIFSFTAFLFCFLIDFFSIIILGIKNFLINSHYITYFTAQVSHILHKSLELDKRILESLQHIKVFYNFSLIHRNFQRRLYSTIITF